MRCEIFLAPIIAQKLGTRRYNNNFKEFLSFCIKSP